MRGLALAQSINKEGRKDATGVFIPGAKTFSRLHGLGAPVLLDDVDDKNKMISAIEKSSNLDVIAYFGHGDRNRIGSAEIGMKDIFRLAEAIRKAAAPGCQVVFYACQLGGLNGFCEKLSRLVGNSVVFWGHSCSGHGNTNPYVTRYPYFPDTTPFIIDPHSPLFHHWRTLIKSGSDIWARFPFMTKSDVEAAATAQRNGQPALQLMFGKAAKKAVGAK